MANKLFLGLLLCSTMAFSQIVKVETVVKTDSLATYIMNKDKEIKFLLGEVKELEAVLRHKDDLIGQADDTINSLLWYREYHKHSHHILSKKIIARIEEMIGHDE